MSFAQVKIFTYDRENVYEDGTDFNNESYFIEMRNKFYILK
jgi:hypothetical protein